MLLAGKHCVVAGAGAAGGGGGGGKGKGKGRDKKNGEEGEGERGIILGNGQATALLMAQHGAASVGCIDINREAAEITAQMIRQRHSQTTVYVVCGDVATDAGAEAVVAAILKNVPRIDVLFNNVGIGVGSLGLEVSEEEWDRVMAVNLKSIVFMSKHVVDVMSAQEPQGGSIINNASMAGFRGHPLLAYSTSKAGVINLTRSMAVIYVRMRIRVNCVAPGFIDTPMVAELQNESRRKMVNRMVPMRRHGKAEEVAGAVVFLASELSSFITGHTITVDGGMSAL
jgi:dihydroanticapsin dehydrogenase